MMTPTWTQRLRTEWPWWLGLFLGAWLVVLVRVLSNVGVREPVLLLLIRSFILGSALAALAVLPFWVLRPWLSRGGTLGLVLTLIGIVPDVLTGHLADAMRNVLWAGGVGLLAVALALTLEGIRRRPGARPPSPAPSFCQSTGRAFPADRTRWQRRVVLLGIGVLVVMLLLPPWISTLGVDQTGHSIVGRVPLGYQPLWTPPSGYAVGIDWERLLVQVAIIGFVAGALYWQTQARPTGGRTPAASKGPGTPPTSSRTVTASPPTSSRTMPPMSDVSPSMAKLFDSDGELLREVQPFDQRGLLAVEPDTLLPTWWPRPTKTASSGVPGSGSTPSSATCAPASTPGFQARRTWGPTPSCCGSLQVCTSSGRSSRHSRSAPSPGADHAGDTGAPAAPGAES